MGHSILSPGFVRTDERGEFIEVLNAGEWRSVLVGAMRPQAVMGNHYHKRTSVFFFLRRGRAEISTVHVESRARDRFVLEAGQGVVLPPGESHAIRYLVDSEFVMLKSERYDPGDPDTYHYPVLEKDAAD